MDWRPPPLMMGAWELELRRELELTHRSSEGPLGFHLRAGAKEGQHKQCVSLSLSPSGERKAGGLALCSKGLVLPYSSSMT